MPRSSSLTIAVLAKAAIAAIPSFSSVAGAVVSVASTDGLTIVAVNSSTGHLAALASPGHAPLTLAAGSGSFIGYGGAARDSVFPNAIIAPCDASDPSQQLSFLPSGRIVSADATHCLDVWNCGTDNGTVVDFYPCDSGATCGDPTRTLNELFSLDNATGALSSLLSAPGELCVDVFGGAGPAVDLWRCTGAPNQQWAYDAATRLFSSIGNPGMCLAAPSGPQPPPPPCSWLRAAAVSGGGPSGAPIVVSRNASCVGGAAVVAVTDTYTPEATSVSWTTAFEVIEASSVALPAFTVPLGATLLPASDTGLGLWTTWTRGCVNNGPGMCFGDGPWTEPFSSLPLPTRTLFRLGNRDYGPVFSEFGGSIDDSITVPLVSLQRPSDDWGVTLLLSPADPLLEVLLRVDGSRIDFARLLRRLGPSTPFNVTAHLRAHAADWRPALQLLVDTHPSHVLPHAANTSDLDGLGGYSWQAPLNRTYADSVGFKTNWELSGTFMPYDGLFAPYQDEWLNLGPINEGLPQYNVTYARIEDFDASVQAAGLNSLSYFDIGNWGVSIDTTRMWPNETCGLRESGAPAPCPSPDGSNAYLAHYLGAALLDSGWSVSGGPFEGAKSDWVGTTLMDPSEPFFEDLLLEQLARRMGPLVPSAQGIAIDRFDYSEYYSYKRDDGMTWIPQASGNRCGPAQSLLNSHIHTYSRIAAALRAASPTKAMLGNCNTLCRIDIAGLFDGGFSEGAALNAVAWVGLRRPTILWTYSLSGLNSSALDEYFQQHVLMRTFPMAPMPANDHSINPGPPAVQQAYADYAPVFFALRGVEWVLDAVRPVASTPDVGQIANVFRVLGTSATPAAPGELLAVVVLGNDATRSTAVVVCGLSLFGAAAAVQASALVPGAAQAWQELGTLLVVNGTVTAPDVPMLRGCSLLRLVPRPS